MLSANQLLEPSVDVLLERKLVETFLQQIRFIYQQRKLVYLSKTDIVYVDPLGIFMRYVRIIALLCPRLEFLLSGLV